MRNRGLSLAINSPFAKQFQIFTVFSLVIYLLGTVGVSPMIPCAVLGVFSRVWRGYLSVFCAHVHCTSQTWRPEEVVHREVFLSCRNKAFSGKHFVYDLTTFLDKIYSLMQEAGRLAAKQPAVAECSPGLGSTGDSAPALRAPRLPGKSFKYPTVRSDTELF